MRNLFNQARNWIVEWFCPFSLFPISQIAIFAIVIGILTDLIRTLFTNDIKDTWRSIEFCLKRCFEIGSYHTFFISAGTRPWVAWVWGVSGGKGQERGTREAKKGESERREILTLTLPFSAPSLSPLGRPDTQARPWDKRGGGWGELSWIHRCW